MEHLGRTDEMDLDGLLPVADQVTRQATHVAAPPEVVWDELHGARLIGLPLTLLLAGARALPVLLAGNTDGGTVTRSFLDLVPVPQLAAEPPSTVLFGGVLQPWRLTGGEQGPALSADEVRAWAEPGWVKTALEFRLTPGLGGTALSCETRVLATDPPTRRRFARYWLVIAPGSAAIRWELLAAVKQRSEFRVRSRAA